MNRNRNNTGQDNDDIQVEKELKKKIKLNDGTDEFLYARGPKYDDNLWPIQCFLCRWTYITNERKFKSHIKSDRHLENLKKAETELPNAEEYRQIYEQVYSDRNNLKNPIKIYAGEDISEITPEYADRLLPIKIYKWDNPPSDTVAELLKPDIIMDYNLACPILGLCYAFKMAKNNKVRYYCVLCKMNLDEMNAYQHFISLEHSTAYAETHYPDTMKLLPSDMTADQKIDVIRFFYQKIEEWKGHRPFYLVNANYFDNLKERFLPRVLKIYHYNENTVKFPENEIKDAADAIKSGKNLVPKYLKKLPNQPETEDKCLMIDTSSEPSPKEAECDNDRNRKRRDRGGSMKRHNDEKESERAKRLNLDDSPANWQKYRIYCDKALRNLNAEYSRFFDISERHPKYQEEWRRFYRLQREKLRRDRINPNDYNFMPDWNRYWMRYLEDCYNADAEKCRFEIRKTLKLPFRCRTPPPTDNIIGNSGAPTSSNTIKIDKGPVPLMDLAISNPFVCDISSDNVVGENFAQFNQSSSRANDGDGLNNDITNVPSQEPQPLIPEDQIQRIQNQQEKESSGSISVLSVLRLLAALEFELGSLGPLVNQLLGKAVLYEKESKMSANELLHETEYFTLFVTSLEKLKAVLQAGVVVELKYYATNKCISDLETILNLFDEYLRRNPNAAQKHIKSSEILARGQDTNEISKHDDNDEPLISRQNATSSLINSSYSQDYQNVSSIKSSAIDCDNYVMRSLGSKKDYDTGDDLNYSLLNINRNTNAINDGNMRGLEPGSSTNSSMVNKNREVEIPRLMSNNFRRNNPFSSGGKNW